MSVITEFAATEIVSRANVNQRIADANSVLSSVVPSTRTINGKPLSADITLSAADVGAVSGEVTTLWSGNINTTTTITLSDSYENYGLIAIEAQNNYDGSKIEWGLMAVGTIEIGTKVSLQLATRSSEYKFESPTTMFVHPCPN